MRWPPTPTPPCCEAWPSWAAVAGWAYDVEDGRVRLMPHLRGTRHRFNYCPSCGADRRDTVAVDLCPPTPPRAPMTDWKTLCRLLASHMAHMQGQLEALHEVDNLEDFYWYQESEALRTRVAAALAAELEGSGDV